MESRQIGGGGDGTTVMQLGSMMQAENAKVAAQFTTAGRSSIQRIPSTFRRLELHGENLFTPCCVAIGPCHRCAPHLQKAEGLKRAAAHNFCTKSRYPLEELYLAVRAVAGTARSYYADDFSRIDDEDFTVMMLVDGCFLLQYILEFTNNDGSPGLRGRPPLMLLVPFRDIFLVENQLPWVVLEALMCFREVPVDRFVAEMVTKMFDMHGQKPQADERIRQYPPLHLLDLVREWQLGPAPELPEDLYKRDSSLFSSAMELAEAGVQVMPSGTARFHDISIGSYLLLFGRLSLPRVVLSEDNKSMLLNMAAFDSMCGRGADIGSCLALLGHLMCSEEDVKELRSKGILFSTLTDRQTLGFLKLAMDCVEWGPRYVHVVTELNEYRRRRRLWVALHRFIYRNFKFLVIAGSFISFSISILKAILAIRHNQS